MNQTIENFPILEQYFNMLNIEPDVEKCYNYLNAISWSSKFEFEVENLQQPIFDINFQKHLLVSMMFYMQNGYDNSLNKKLEALYKEQYNKNVEELDQLLERFYGHTTN